MTTEAPRRSGCPSSALTPQTIRVGWALTCALVRKEAPPMSFVHAVAPDEDRACRTTG